MPPLNVAKGARTISVVVRTLPARALVPRHAHDHARLIYAVQGVMSVSTAQGSWVVPPERAIWVPPHTDHEIRSYGAEVMMRSLDLAPRGFPRLQKSSCCVVGVSRLMRELVLRHAELAGQPPSLALRLIRELMALELRQLPVSALHLPMPRDARLREVCERIVRNPGDRLTLDDWGRRVGASSRTLARHFVAETGMNFQRWRQQARLMEALTRLASGQSVTAVAMDLGYDSPSAFTAMFRRTLGCPPRSYFVN
ncbi:AraC family transcriptional regulator [Bordetella tumulicola]